VLHARECKFARGAADLGGNLLDGNLKLVEATSNGSVPGLSDGTVPVHTYQIGNLEPGHTY
jgi:hypothetical protein